MQPGEIVAHVLDTAHMELKAKINEADRANLKPGEPVEVKVDALPGEVFRASVKTVAGMASSDMWGGGDSARKFDATVELEKPDKPEDQETLRRLLENHYKFTGSPLAKAVLDDFEKELRWFVKVMPTDYRDVLSEIVAHRLKNDKLDQVFPNYTPRFRNIVKHG